MDDSGLKFVTLVPLVEPQPGSFRNGKFSPSVPAKVPAETRSSDEEAAERIVKTSKFRN